MVKPTMMHFPLEPFLLSFGKVGLHGEQGNRATAGRINWGAMKQKRLP
jgi:hypothetical protein